MTFKSRYSNGVNTNGSPERAAVIPEIDCKRTVLITVSAGLLFKPPQHHCQLFLKDAHREWLCHIIVRAQFVAFEHIAFHIVCGQEDNRRIRAAFFCLPAEIKTIPVRQVYIQLRSNHSPASSENLLPSVLSMRNPPYIPQKVWFKRWSSSTTKIRILSHSFMFSVAPNATETSRKNLFFPFISLVFPHFGVSARFD